MDPPEPHGADDVQVFQSPVATLPRWLLLAYTLNLLAPLVHVLSRRDPFRPFWGALLGLWAVLMVVFVVGRRREKRRPAELVFTSREVVKRPGFGRTRSTPWSEVEKLYVDPPGGPRYVNLILRNGRYLRLAAVREEDVLAVKARWESVRAARSAQGLT